MLIDASL